MKKIVCAAVIGLALSVSLAGISIAAKPKAEDFRRSLFVPLGEDQLVFEAPLKMCFFDASKSSERAITDMLARQTARKKQEVFLATFASCASIANAGNAMVGADLRGIINWANPKIGEKSPYSRADYLDMREPTFKTDLAADIYKWFGISISLKDTDEDINFPDGYYLDKQPKRTAVGLFIGFSSNPPFESSGVFATTTIRDYPVEFFLIREGANIDSDEIIAIAEKLLAQQIALNE